MAKEIKTEILIKSTSEKVWAILTDFEHYPEWNPFIRSLTGNVAVGNQIKLRLVPPNSNGMMFKPEVLVFEEEKEFRWLGHLLFRGLFDGTHRFEIIENKNGTVTFRQSEQFKGILTYIFGRKQFENTKKGFELMNEAIKKIAESK